MSAKMGRPITVGCGEPAAYKRALRNKAKGLPHCGPCQPCKDANSKAQRGYYRARKGIT